MAAYLAIVRQTELQLFSIKRKKLCHLLTAQGRMNTKKNTHIFLLNACKFGIIKCKKIGDLGSGEMDGSTDYSSRGPQFNYRQPHGAHNYV